MTPSFKKKKKKTKNDSSGTFKRLLYSIQTGKNDMKKLSGSR